MTAACGISRQKWTRGTFSCCASVGIIFDRCFTWQFFCTDSCSPSPSLSAFCQHLEMGCDSKRVSYVKRLLFLAVATRFHCRKRTKWQHVCVVLQTYWIRFPACANISAWRMTARITVHDFIRFLCWVLFQLEHFLRCAYVRWLIFPHYESLLHSTILVIK
jgi:hypothetical protein